MRNLENRMNKLEAELEKLKDKLEDNKEQKLKDKLVDNEEQENVVTGST